ncbi:MAG: hypothetical protein NUW23_10140 [Firmicutes bacterium]|jgi:hypothetical protein|nr:hypothetical protein [Bacillota bacterium]
MKKILANAVLVVFFLILFAASHALANVAVVGSLTRQSTVEPGQKVDGSIVLRNNGSDPVEIKVEQCDYLFYADGRTDYARPGGNPRSNAGWMAVAPARLVIPPNEVGFVYYTIRVPNDPELKGTYWSIIMVEPVPSTSPESIRAKEGNYVLGVQTVLRYGIQVITNVGTTGAKNVKILNRKLERGQDGTCTLLLDLENTGEQMITPEVRAEVYDREGRLVGTFKGTRKRIYPTTSVRYAIPFEGLAKGRYRILVVIDDGDSAVWGAQYSVEL